MAKYTLVNAQEMVAKAYKNKYAIAHININNLEWTKVVLQAAQETQTPLIIGVSEGAAKYMGGLLTAKQLVCSLMTDLKITVPVALHLDHGSFEGCKQAIKVGFSSIMFDGSKLPFKKNYQYACKLVELIKKPKISLETEVGSIGGEEDGVKAMGELADIAEAQQMAQLPIFALAAGIGNIHGIYPANWKSLNFDHLSKLNKAVQKPIVLHGGSNIPNDQVKKAIKLGVAKVNVNTELQLAFAAAVRKYIEDKKDLDLTNKGYDPRKILKGACLAMKDVVIDKFKLFGCYGKAKK